jgi:PleD family two-component response regulator
MGARSDISNARLDLQTATILIVESSAAEQDILAQMLAGFGASSVQRRRTAEEAIQACEQEAFSFCLVDATLKESEGYDVVMALRRHEQTSVKHLPIILIGSQVLRRDVVKARDCGANFVLIKPILPQVLFDRLVALARDRRQFVETDTYVGPDRRFKAFGPPAGMKGRRHDDLSADVGEAKEENLSQNAIDDFFSATKAPL